MQHTKYYCDICKQEFKPSDLKQIFFMGRNMDLCNQCNSDLVDKFIFLEEAAKAEVKSNGG